MGTHRPSPLILPTILAALFAVPLVLIHAPYRPLYPALLVLAAVVWMYRGRALRLALLVLAVLLGPVVWRLMEDAGSAEAATVFAGTGATGAMVYLRQFVFDGAPRLAWMLLGCVVLLGFAVGQLAQRLLPSTGVSRDSSRFRLGFALLALFALALAVPRVKLRLWEARNAVRLARRAKDEDARFLARVHAGAAGLDRSPLVARNDVDVVLYVGESSSRWDWSLYGYPRSTNAPLARDADSTRLVAFSAAIAPRGAYEQPPPDGLSSLGFLFRQKGQEVVPLVQLLARARVSTVWLSNARKPWSYDDALAGTRRVDAAWRYDADLLLPLRDALHQTGSKLVVLDGYAGHFPWCDGVPPDRRVAWNDWMSHLPAAAIWGNGTPHRAALDCYDSAIAYTSATLGDAMRVVNQAPRPTLLLYVPNRGEDAWGQPGRYGSARGARETDVPLLVYANSEFSQRHWQMLANARRNRDRPVASAWVFDAVLDAFGVMASDSTLQGDRRLSVFDASYDPRAADSVTLTATGVGAELERRARLEAERGGRFCTHRGNTLLKYLEGKALYDCVEMDVVLDTSARGDGPAFVYHPPVVNPGLPLYDLLERAGVPRLGLWLDVKNLNERNAPGLLARLSTLVPPDRRGRVLIETSNDALASSPVLHAIADSGFVPSYYLPTDLGCACLRSTGGECAREMARLATELRGGGFRGLSFDARGRVLARALRATLAPQPVLNTWTPMDRCPDGSRAMPLADQARDSLLVEVQKYLIRMPSAFQY